MAIVTLGGNPIHTIGDLPLTGTQAPAFTLIDTNLSAVQLADFAGQNVVLNIFQALIRLLVLLQYVNLMH